MKKLRVLIAGGGTGGHLFPGLAVGEEILNTRPGSELRFVGTVRGIEKNVIPEKGIRLYTLPVAGLYRVGKIKQILTLIKLPLSILKSIWILLTYRPHLLIGVGGYASGPMLIAGLLLRRKLILQEQNASPGMTNRILGKYAPLSFVPFEAAKKFFRNAEVVGNPIRREIKELAEQNLSQESDKFRIFIFGGSQGARILNQTLVSTLPLLEEFHKEIVIIHQTGVSARDEIEKEYEKFPIEYQIHAFIKDMKSEYANSHLIICRSGSSVNEIIAAGRASVLVPIANSSGDHQKKNALAIHEAKAGVMIEEKDLNAEKLASEIISFIKDPEKRIQFEKNSKTLYPGDSAKIIVDKTLSFFKL